MDLETLARRISTLTLVRDLYDDALVHSLAAYLSKPSGDSYAKLAYELMAEAKPLGEALFSALLGSDNAYMRVLAQGKEPTQGMKEAFEYDLETLQAAADLSASELLSLLDSGASAGLPTLDTCSLDLISNYKARTKKLSRYGYGIYAQYRAFVLSDDGAIVAVKNPDETKLQDLVGYSREKNIILDNTRALLKRLPAANMLLTGDAGTGKSSTVKAVVNELWDEGLRIIELRKSQLHLLGNILDELTHNPLAFILFIDDLSFSANDDDYAALKAVLEGSVAAKSRNVCVYATSNRRHLIRERFSDREGDEVHLNETMQELASLSERFGIRVSFSRPDKATYLEIVKQLAQDADVMCDDIEADAERFALRSGGRSARRARQFVDALISQTAH